MGAEAELEAQPGLELAAPWQLHAWASGQWKVMQLVLVQGCILFAVFFTQGSSALCGQNRGWNR